MNDPYRAKMSEEVDLTELDKFESEIEKPAPRQSQRRRPQEIWTDFDEDGADTVPLEAIGTIPLETSRDAFDDKLYEKEYDDVIPLTAVAAKADRMMPPLAAARKTAAPPRSASEPKKTEHSSQEQKTGRRAPAFSESSDAGMNDRRQSRNVVSSRKTMEHAKRGKDIQINKVEQIHGEQRKTGGAGGEFLGKLVQNPSRLWYILSLVIVVGILIVLLVSCVGGEELPPADAGTTDSSGGAAVVSPDEGNGGAAAIGDPTDGTDEDPADGTDEPPMEETTLKTVYVVIESNLSWEEARKECESKHGHLATFTSEEEYLEIIAEAEKHGLTYLWLGARLDADSWDNQTWITGESMDYVKANGDLWYKNEKVQEPSGFDPGDGVAEPCLCLWRPGDGAQWSLNDQRNDPFADYPKQFSGKMGYILEMKVEG